MGEKSPTDHIVMRMPLGGVSGKQMIARPARSSEDREPARNYAERMNKRSKRYYYYVESCKKL